jgi:hypothetical protein
MKFIIDPKFNRKPVIEPMVVPDFTPEVPAFLTSKLNPRDKYIVETLSIIGKKFDFALSQLEKQNKNQIELEQSQIEIEKALSIIFSKWSIIMYAMLLVWTLFGDEIKEKIWDKPPQTHKP